MRTVAASSNPVRASVALAALLLTVTTAPAGAYVEGQSEPTPEPRALVHPDIPGAPAGALVPAESCAADPQREGCPPVEEVVVLTSSSSSSTAIPPCTVPPPELDPDCPGYIGNVLGNPLEDNIDAGAVEGTPLAPYAPHDYAEGVFYRESAAMTAEQYVVADAESAANGEGDIPPGYACALRPGDVERSFFDRPGDYYVYAFTDHKCRSFHGVSYQEAGSSLLRYNKAQGYYVRLASDFESKGGGGSLRQLYVGYDCNHNGIYTYKNDAYGYSVVRGRGYFQPDARYENWTC